MKIETTREKNIDSYVKVHSPVDDQKHRVILSGEVQIIDVYRIPTRLLIFNIRNGRFASELLAKEEELKRKLNPTDRNDEKVIQALLLGQNKDETQALKDDLIKHGQIDPGIITFDGAVINANRRMAILKQLFEETSEQKYEFLRVARLPKNVDEKDLWRIEAGLQFAKDFRLEYGPINELLKLKEGKERGLSLKDISNSLLGRYNPKKVEEKLRTLKLIESYLELIGKRNEYHHIQEERIVEKFNSLQSYVIGTLEKRGASKSEIADLTTLAFSIIKNTDLSHWEIRKLAKIFDEKNAKTELFKAYERKKPLEVKPERIREAFTTSLEIVEDKKEQDKPERLLKKALSAISAINLKSNKLKEKAVIELLTAIKGHLEKLIDSAKKK